MDDCIFCKILRGEIPSKKLYEDDEILAFEDINPAAAVHFLIIPKKHISSAAELRGDGAVAAHIFARLDDIARLAGVHSYRVITNIGEDAGQTVRHLHFHVLGGEPLGEKLR